MQVLLDKMRDWMPYWYNFKNWFQVLKLKKILISLLYIIALFSYNLTSPAKAADKLKVVYHVSEIEKVPFVLGNMRNHINGVGGPGKVDLILVVHGPAGKAFHKSKTNPKIEQRVDNLSIDGVKFNMCGNTMRAQKVERIQKNRQRKFWWKQSNAMGLQWKHTNVTSNSKKKSVMDEFYWELTKWVQKAQMLVQK